MEPTVGRARGLAPVLGAAAVLLGGMTLSGDPLAAIFDQGPTSPGGVSGGEGDGFPRTAVLGGLLVFGLCQRHALVGAAPFRAADAVTLLRTTLLGLFVAVLIRRLLAETAPSEHLVLSWSAVALAVVILLLDGADGAVARACGGGTTAGRHYDDIADAVVLLVLAAAAGGLLEWWAVLAGAAKPLFALGGRFRSRWRGALRPSGLRRALGTAPGALLLAAIAPLPWEDWTRWFCGTDASPSTDPADGRLVAAGLAVLLVAVSFGRDIADLERRAVGPGRG
ncbi:CDP-alcohol phosphatidyltransferase family protein [Nesterenkonia sp. F]|uniref:CDP-alcohol phosphatidyltransferase family protein n=1 Tax=Nesterenkonia sp. F TaxID=795955 RepID=UPI000255D234|nr:CDP-alcohol phosphatidyltransferase family protein [Nesterenkonia sp. F]